ncbi:MAG: alpha/beta hydrolase, partial [Actinomycetota bacterium]|nr:alpha/beta hydrolase [Actinomycetota bacterium]
LAACGGESSTSPPKSDRTSGTPASSSPPASPTASALPRIEGPVGQGETVEGLVDVDGHDIYARCSGTGSPTAVYFSGWTDDPSRLAVSAIQGVESVAGGEHRICSYERRNTGRSETVDGTQSPQDVVGDVDGVLAAMGEEGPFVLLGASFGGLVAGAYAVAHPDSVAGILLLDSSIPDDYVIDEAHGFQGMCLKANREADANESLEKIDNCRLAKWAYDRRDQEPEVPLIYLAAEDPSDRGGVADDPLRKAFVERWSPGTWEPVSAPHWMEEADPELVVKYLERVIALAS